MSKQWLSVHSVFSYEQKYTTAVVLGTTTQTYFSTLRPYTVLYSLYAIGSIKKIIMYKLPFGKCIIALSA